MKKYLFPLVLLICAYCLAICIIIEQLKADDEEIEPIKKGFAENFKM